MLGLGVVNMANDEKHPYSMTPTHMNSIWMCEQSMLRIFFSNIEYVSVSYDLMWVCIVYSP